jgi:hexaprenyl-diphosphate synthase
MPAAATTATTAAVAMAGGHPQEQWVPSLGIALDGHSSSVDPFQLVADDLDTMTRSVSATVSVLQHPVLNRAASHLFSLRGKRLRPIMVILMGHATSILAPSPAATSVESTDDAGTSALAAVSTTTPMSSILLGTQLRLAEITEMIHAASLLHDDVIDTAESRRGLPTVNSVFGNQLAVLAGDFLLARASVALARLRDCDVVELLSTVIEHLVRGEVIQMNGGSSSAGGIGDVSAEDMERQRHYHQPCGLFETYMSKTFFKTASLMANSCRAVTMLAGHGLHVADAAYAYGEHLGIAFQLVDDMLDFTGTASSLGKPVLNDLKQGHATAPVLFALEAFPDELGPMVTRRFRSAGDVEATLRMIERADGLGQTRELAARHARIAVVSLTDALPPSDARSALVNIADYILTRQR